MSDMKKILEKMDQFAGQAVGQKPGDQVRGTEKAKPRKDGKHPFAGRLVGASESIIKELNKTAKETAIQRKLAEAYEDYEDEEDEQPDGFYVAISSEDSGVFVGMLTKQGGKWRESTVHGKPPYNWGGGYMGYLTPQDIMQWIHKDYGRSYDVEGPFFDDSEVQDYIDMMSEGIVGRAIAKGKDMLDRLDGNPNPNNLINQKRKEKQDQRKKQRQQGVSEEQEVDASVVIGKLYDIIDHAENMIKNADFDRQVQYATTVRDRAVKSLNMIKTNPQAANSAWKYFQNGQQSVTESEGKVDTVKMDVPLMIRMLEYAREDAQTDMDLHDVAERMIKLGQGDRTLTMDDYDKICIGQEQGVAEGLGLYGPFTATINTGERPKSRTKTKKFRREDDAILWAQDWLEDAPQYVFATAEVTDPEGNVVWTTDESLGEQGVAEEQEADYGKNYQAMVQRVGQKAKAQEKKKPVDIAALAAKLKAADEKLRQLKEVNTVAPTAPTNQGGAPNLADPAKAAMANTQKNLSKLKTVDPNLNPGLANQALQTMANNPNAPVSGAQLNQAKNLADLVGDALSDPQKGPQVATMLQQVQQAQKLKK